MKRIIIVFFTCFALGSNLSYSQPYTLDECKEMALKNNKKIRNAELDVEMSFQNKKKSFTAYFPNLSASALGFYGFDDLMRMDVDLPPVGKMPMSFVDKGVISSITLVQPVFAGLQIVNSNKLANLQTDLSLLQKRQTENEVIQKTVEYYWNIASLKNNLSTLNFCKEMVDEVYREVEVSVNAGMSNRNDLLKIEIRQQEISSNILKLENNLKISKLLLAIHIGVNSDLLDINENDMFDPTAPSKYYVPAENVVESMIEYRMANMGVKAEEYMVNIERGKNLPKVSVGISDLYYNLTDRNINNGVLMASVSIPISSWWGGTHAVKQAKLKHKQAMINKEEVKEMLGLEVEKSWADVVEAYSQIELAKKSKVSACENLRLSRGYYEAGTSTLGEFLDAESLYIQTCTNYNVACANYQCKLEDYLVKIANQ